VQPFRDLADPLQDSVGRVPYLDVQAGGDATFPPGRRYYWKAQFLGDPPDAAFDALIEAYCEAPSTGCLAVLQHVGGAIARVPSDATAYANRDASYDCFPAAIWDRPEEDAAHMNWARAVWSALQPFSTGGVYANNLGDEGEQRVKAAYGDNFERLAEVKSRYDPKNLFRGNQNVHPGRPGR
jgi:FAD/FMN-containing dehydrogenase